MSKEMAGVLNVYGVWHCHHFDKMKTQKQMKKQMQITNSNKVDLNGVHGC